MLTVRGSGATEGVQKTRDFLASYTGDPADVLEALADLLERPGWHQQALCRTRPDLPWRGHEDSVTAEITREMRQVCHRCPVFTECREASQTETAAFWAGRWRSPQALDRERRRRRLQATQTGADRPSAPFPADRLPAAL